MRNAKQILERLSAGSQARSFYQLLFRNAGWGVMWYEPARHQKQVDERDIRSGLVVYKYHPTLMKCLRAELKRIESEPL